MRTSRFTIAALLVGTAFCLSVNPSAHGQESSSEAQKVPGFLNLKSGQFSPVSGVHVVPETSSTMFTRGTIELTLTINVVSDLPRGTAISCGMDVNVTALNVSDGALGSWVETASAVASVHGTTATCTLIIPYYWLLPSAAENELRTLSGRFTVTATDASIKPSVLRSTNQPFLSTTTIPSNDTTSKYRANATI
jgi:hypothetical protein